MRLSASGCSIPAECEAVSTSKCRSVTSQLGAEETLEPIGLLQPRERLGGAARTLSDFLLQPSVAQ